MVENVLYMSVKNKKWLQMSCNQETEARGLKNITIIFFSLFYKDWPLHYIYYIYFLIMWIRMQLNIFNFYFATQMWSQKITLILWGNWVMIELVSLQFFVHAIIPIPLNGLSWNLVGMFLRIPICASSTYFLRYCS